MASFADKFLKDLEELSEDEGMQNDKEEQKDQSNEEDLDFAEY